MPYERDLIKDINFLRRNLRGFVDKITDKIYFKGNIWKHTEAKAGIIKK